ncbi:MAG: DUF5305 family protein [Bacillota bacterium]
MNGMSLKRVKTAIIIVIALLICTDVFLLYKQLSSPGTTEEKIPKYSYTQKSNVEYKVTLKPNILYEEAELEANKVYLSAYVDSIIANFMCEFKGERQAEISGTYEITAVMEGYVAENDKVKTIWKKDFVLLPQESFSEKGTGISFNKEVPFQLDQYGGFAFTVIDETKVGLQSKLTATMNVKLTAVTDSGVIELTMSPAIVIPLNENFFEISCSKPEEIKEALTESKMVAKPVNYRLIYAYAAIMVLLGLSIFAVLMLFKKLEKTTPFVKSLNKIFKNHGNRMVALYNEIETMNKAAVKVKSIDDLVRIADEIGKPILYRYDEDFTNITKFYIITENCTYMYDIEAEIISRTSAAANNKGAGLSI